MSRVAPSPIMELIKTTAGGGYISFASGLPDPSLYPVETIAELTDAVLAKEGRAALQYGESEGYRPLRAFVAEMLRQRGIPATVDHILITNGGQQAIDITARTLLDPGDGVILDNPSYLAAIQAFDSCECRFLPVPMDVDGMKVDGIPCLLDQHPKLLYALPNFQNPTGITLSLSRRRALAELADRMGLAILEDDVYYDLRYEGEPLPPLAALADNPWCVYTGSFSKVIAPGLRVGFLCAPPPLAARLGQLKQVTDLHTGSLTQRVVYEYCERGLLAPGIERLRAVYRARRDALLAALEEHLSGCVEWTRPAGGMFLLARLPEGRNATALLHRAMERGVVFVPGDGFHPYGGGENTFRLNFGSVDEAKIAEGIRILAEVIREWTA